MTEGAKNSIRKQNNGVRQLAKELQFKDRCMTKSNSNTRISIVHMSKSKEISASAARDVFLCWMQLKSCEVLLKIHVQYLGICWVVLYLVAAWRDKQTFSTCETLTAYHKSDMALGTPLKEIMNAVVNILTIREPKSAWSAIRNPNMGKQLQNPISRIQNPGRANRKLSSDLDAFQVLDIA